MLNRLINKTKIDHANRYVSKGLGIFSLILGICEAVAPKFFARHLGLFGKQSLMRGYGFREMANGVLLLLSKNPAFWLWTRVAGDALDLAALKTAKGISRPKKRNLWIAVAAVGGIAILDILSASVASRKSRS